MKIFSFMIMLFGCAISSRIMAQNRTDVKSSIARGKIVYEQNCLACHQSDGSGVPYLAPPLIKGTFVAGDKTRLIGIILQGLKDVEIGGENYANPMPAFDFLSDQEIADVLTYVRSYFSNNASAVSMEDVTKTRKQK